MTLSIKRHKKKKKCIRKYLFERFLIKIFVLYVVFLFIKLFFKFLNQFSEVFESMMRFARLFDLNYLKLKSNFYNIISEIQNYFICRYFIFNLRFNVHKILLVVINRGKIVVDQDILISITWLWWGSFW